MIDAELWVVGHTVIDYVIDNLSLADHPRVSLGGPVPYCSIALSSLGAKPHVVTKIGSDFPDSFSKLLYELTGISLESMKLPGEKTTSFRIDRTVTPRRMWLLAKCKSIEHSDFTFLQGCSNERALIVNTVAGEVSLETLDRVSKKYDKIFLDSQGFVRTFSKIDGEVGMKNRMDLSALSGVDFLKADRRELSAWTGVKDTTISIKQVCNFATFLILTDGPRKVEIYEGATMKYRAKPVGFPISDTTGAGDIFLSVFASAFLRQRDIPESLALATAASSLSVRKFGIEKAILDVCEVNALGSKIKVERF
jgi:sugar/nucleoside kinase (ribokinase family)